MEDNDSSTKITGLEMHLRLEPQVVFFSFIFIILLMIIIF